MAVGGDGDFAAGRERAAVKLSQGLRAVLRPSDCAWRGWANFWIPQRGLFVIGGAFFERFDASRHSSATSQAAHS